MLGISEAIVRTVLPLLVTLFTTSTALADNPLKCKAVLPLGFVSIMNGYVNVDGTLLLDGESQCTVVNIECRKDTMMCTEATSDVSFVGALPIISRIVRNDFNVIKWTDRELVAAGEAGLCGWVEIYMNLASKDVKITSSTSTARSGCDEAGKSEFFKALVNGKTQVFHVGSDPYWKGKNNN
jgi:hypothetical protein